MKIKNICMILLTFFMVSNSYSLIPSFKKETREVFSESKNLILENASLNDDDHIRYWNKSNLPATTFDSCTVGNPNSQIVEDLLIDLLQYVINNLNQGQDETFFNGTAPPELVALLPYITDVDKGVINNFTILSPNDHFAFSFSPSHPGIYDIELNSANGLNLFTTLPFNPDLDLSQYQDYNTPLLLSDFQTSSNPKADIKLLSIQHIDFCPSSNNENEFCLSEMEEYPTIADLYPNGSYIEWFITETGGTPLDETEELIENPSGTSYWWEDINSSDPRSESLVIVYGQTLEEEENQYQVFSQGVNATIANLLPIGAIWYDNTLYTTPLADTTPLVSSTTYYGELPGVECKFYVEVFIGTLPPTGDGIQYLCPGQTIQDIEIQLQDVLSTAVWYDVETGGSSIPETTELVNNTTYYVAQIDSYGFESEERLAITVFLNTVNQPIVPFPIQTFDIDQTPPPTIADLIAYGYDIQWYSQEVGGNVYGESEPLVHGNYYWAEQNVGPCPSTRVRVLVQIIEIPEPPLLGCEKFKPQPGDRYIINAWVREQGVLPVNPQVKLFNNSYESNLFLDLLNHLLFVTQHEDSDIHDINDITNDGYIPTSPVENLDFDPLIPFVKFIGEEIKLKVYNYERLTDDYGRSVGFKFKLSSDDQAPMFEWQSPLVTGQVYRYPINDNPELGIEFTNVEVQGNNIIITSNFIANGNPSQSDYNEPYSSVSGIEESITESDYEEVPNFQPMNYMNTFVEITYQDEEQNVFLPDNGELPIFEPKGEIIDGWQRVYGEFIIPGNAAQMTINLKNTSDSDNNQLAYFDDIRMHPYNSSMKTFVYHPVTQRLMSELDENNYATFYEYDAEGGLIRVKKETEKGIYTIQETRSSTTKQTN